MVLMGLPFATFVCLLLLRCIPLISNSLHALCCTARHVT